MKITKTKTNIRERLASLLDFKQLLSGLKRAGINIGEKEHLLDIKGDVQADDYDLNNVDALLDVDAVEIYIYDTTQDSDGGAWRHNTQHTSWYNEPLNTDTRGARREFPVIALIVAESKRLTIFDADGPSIDMWMRFDLSTGDNGYDSYALGDTRATLTCCCAKNATIITGSTGGGFNNLWEMCLLTETFDRHYGPATGSQLWSGDISQRHQLMSWRTEKITDAPLDGYSITDVDITVLSDAPVDQATGLQVPTIVCLDETQQIQLITHDKKVVYITSDDIHGEPKEVEFQGDKIAIVTGNNYDRGGTGVRLIDIPASNINLVAQISSSVLQGKRFTVGDWAHGHGARKNYEEHLQLPIFTGNWLNTEQRAYLTMTTGLNKLFIGSNQANIHYGSQYSTRDWRGYSARYNTGLTDTGTLQTKICDYFDRRGVVLATTDGSEARFSDMCAHITHNHNTGWMVGDNKLTTLCDTKPGKIGVDVSTELVTDLFEAFPLNHWSVNLNDGGNFDENSFQKNSDGQLVAVTLTAKAGQSYFKSAFRSLKQLGLKTDKNYRMVVTARTTSISDGYEAYVALYQQNHGSQPDTGDPDGNSWIRLANSGNYKPLTNVASTFELDFQASNHDNDYLSVYFFMQNAAADQEIIIESISIKQNDNLLLDGDMRDGAAISQWKWYVVDGAPEITNDQIKLVRSDSGTDLVAQRINVESNKQHVLSFELNKSSTNNGFVYISYNDPAGTDPVGAHFESDLLIQVPYLEAGKYSVCFFPEQDHVYIGLKGNNNGTCIFDNITCKVAERDRSSWDQGLFVNGQIEKSPVAPGAELVSYHGFTTDNYISQHFNHEMFFDNDDWCMSYWFYKDPNNSRTYDSGIVLQGTDFETSATAGVGEFPHGGYISTYFKNDTSTLHCLYRGLNDRFYTARSIGYKVSRWHQLMFMRRDDMLCIFLDGVLSQQFNLAGWDRTGFGEFPRKLYIGRQVLAGTPMGTDAKFALLKIGATAPTDTQIEQIYQEESRLFQDGAKCTLQSDTDNVLTLCHDSTSELLHVGTNDHVTSFKNLIVSDDQPGRADLIASKSNIYIQQ